MRGLFTSRSVDGPRRGNAASEPGRPAVKLVGIQALHHDAVVLVALAPADLDRGGEADEAPETREAQQLRSDLLRELLRRKRPGRPRRQLHLQLAVVRAAAVAAHLHVERLDIR